MKAHLHLRLSGRQDRSARFHCPSCGTAGAFIVYIPDPPFPISARIQCSCGCLIGATVYGYELNPTGEAPAIEDENVAPYLMRLERRLSKN